MRVIISHEFQIFSLTHVEANHHSKTRSPFSFGSLVAHGRVTFHSLSVVNDDSHSTSHQLGLKVTSY